MRARPKISRTVRVIAGACVAGAGVAGISIAEQARPTLNFNGVTGLIDMPTGDSQPDAQLSTTVSGFAGITRTTLSFQITPRLSGSFRYSGTRDLNFGGYVDYYDRSFDLRFKVLDEGQIVPAVTIGLQDFAGTGLASGEYVAATKHVTPQLAVTAGLGWGRLGSYSSIGSPFGDRPAISIGRGGKPNFETYFRGPAAPFAGIEWQPNDRWGLKAEYSSDAYTLETGQGVFDRKSPWNFGVEYQATNSLRLGAYSLYGSEFGVSVQLSFNPKFRPGGGDFGPAPLPVEVRPSRQSDPDAWSPEWITQPNAPQILRANTAARLNDMGLTLEAMEITSNRAQIWVRNTRYENEAEAIGRSARALTRAMPASVEVFEIVAVVKGTPTTKVTMRRSDVEALENAPNGAARMLAAAELSDAPQRPKGLVPYEDLYPRLTWNFGPYLQQAFFDPDQPYRADVGLRLSGEYEMAPGWILSGSVAKKLAGTLDNNTRTSNSTLPHVRTDGPIYYREGDPAVEHLTAAHYWRPGPDLYGRVTVGYLERMFGGVSGELLWMPADSRLALGIEANYAKQRDVDGMFGFQDYDVLSGHVSAYYDLSKGYQAQIDAGRYLAGDWGTTLTLNRTFGNGWKVGAFATLTDVSADDFGEGSFDKGIRVEIPLSWISGQPSRNAFATTIRPVTRDGGARLNVDGRLYDVIEGYHQDGLETEWGTFWR